MTHQDHLLPTQMSLLPQARVKAACRGTRERVRAEPSAGEDPRSEPDSRVRLDEVTQMRIICCFGCAGGALGTESYNQLREGPRRPQPVCLSPPRVQLAGLACRRLSSLWAYAPTCPKHLTGDT